jgi:hypothetical protein
LSEIIIDLVSAVQTSSRGGERESHAVCCIHRSLFLTAAGVVWCHIIIISHLRSSIASNTGFSLAIDFCEFNWMVFSIARVLSCVNQCRLLFQSHNLSQWFNFYYFVHVVVEFQVDMPEKSWS